jgi:putative membrane-bound dehydrogenase-like protein
MIAAHFLSFIVTSAAFAAEPPHTHQVKLNGQTFTLPQGFTIELAADAKLAPRPITADFDEKGRLYFADANGNVTKEDVAQKRPMHRILRLEDTDGDGKFDKSVVFADQMQFPEGTMWLDGSLYVAAPPHIWKLTDTNNDGVADKREIWFDGKTLTGCANDLHGPYRGPDGWIYWAKGAFAKQEYGKFVTRASHIFRARPDGTGIEPVMTGGMDNPVDVVFTPTGERIFTTTFFQHPADGKRDGLIHAVYGGIYGKVHDVIFDPVHKWTGPDVMPVLTHMGPAAPCGLHRLESDSFGPEYKDNIFCCQFNMRKVSRHVLIPDGSTYRTEDSDFVVSDSLDFHPTDVIEDADGSLLIVDTGGWYKLCCPTSQLVKPDVLGGIYRVRRTERRKPPGSDDPRGLKIDWTKSENWLKLLDDPRPAVRQRAIHETGKRPDLTLIALERLMRESKSAEVRCNILWAAARFDLSPWRTLHAGNAHLLISCINFARGALTDPDERVRRVALHLMSLYRFTDADKTVVKLLEHPSPQVRRAAAEAIGLAGDKVAVPALLKTAGQPVDRCLEHAITYALIEIADRDGTAAALTNVNPLVRRLALVALDQMPDVKVPAKAALAEFAWPDAAQRQTAAWIAGRHPEWGGELAEHYRTRLNARPLKSAENEELANQLAKLAKNETIQKLLADYAILCPEVCMRAMARAGLKQTPARWIEELTDAFSHTVPTIQWESLATARALPIDKTASKRFVSELTRLGRDKDQPDAVRLAALAAVPNGALQLDDGLLGFLIARFERNQSSSMRASAVDVLTRAALTSDQLVQLAAALKTAGPVELPRLLYAFKGVNEMVGLALVASLDCPEVRPMIRTEMIKPTLDKHSANVQKAAAKLFAALDAQNAQQRSKLESLFANLKDGDVRRGQVVFNSEKAACFSCHKIGYKGGAQGPDLTRIGAIRTERDLLESIVFPSLSFVRSYEPVRVTTISGKDYNGILKKDAPDEVILALNAQEEVRIARKDIDEMTPSNLSIMPAGLDQQLTTQDLADLVAFLKACK